MFIKHVTLASLLTLLPLAAVAQTPTPAAQTTPADQPAQAASPSEPAGPVTATSILQPAILDVQGTLGALKIDKWKRGSVRDEAGDNIKAILADLQNNLPPLVTAADAAPASVSPSVPLVKHLGAVYDVLLRVEEASRVSGPPDQVAQLQQTLKTFERARLALYDRLQQTATDQEKKITDLQAALTKAQTEIAAVAEKPAPKSEPCKPAAPARRKRHTAPAAKPAQPAQQQAPKPQ